MPPTPTPPIPATLTFLELAEVVLRQAGVPLSANEIWAEAVRLGLVGRLRSQGKTPEQTIGAQLYRVSPDDSRFSRVGERPTRFAIPGMKPAPPGPESGPEVPPVAPLRTRLSEREMHPVLVHFAHDAWGARCKTVFHEKSQKGSAKQNEWLHPDIVGFTLLTDGWDAAPRNIAARLGARPVHLYSFELKREIDFSTLRQYFFQAVSNSSWAHEGYLVLWMIEPDPPFREELQRLSQSFGIGVIHLRPDAPGDSMILHPARVRADVDWAMVNRLFSANEDFKTFIEQVDRSAQINDVVAKTFDDLPTAEKLEEIAKKAAVSGARS